MQVQDLNDAINRERDSGRQPFSFLEVNAEQARTETEFKVGGYGFAVINLSSGSDFVFRLNNVDYPQVSFRRVGRVRQTFYSLFITNVQGNGKIQLLIFNTENADFTLRDEVDGAEIAARLGSPMTFDRQGELLWFDDMEEGLVHLETSFVGAGGGVAIDSDNAFRGHNSIALTGGSDSDRTATLRHRHFLPVLTRIGLEITWSIDVNVDTFDGIIDFYTGSLLISFGMRFDRTTSTNFIQEQGPVFTSLGSVFGGAAMPLGRTVFFSTKLVCDPSILKYHRAQYSPLPLAIADRRPHVAVNATFPHLDLQIIVTSANGENGVASVDDFIITQNEP